MNSSHRPFIHSCHPSYVFKPFFSAQENKKSQSSQLCLPSQQNAMRRVPSSLPASLPSPPPLSPPPHPQSTSPPPTHISSLPADLPSYTTSPHVTTSKCSLFFFPSLLPQCTFHLTMGELIIFSSLPAICFFFFLLL